MATTRVLLLVSTSSYRTEAFLDAARALGAEPVVGSDRCHVLDGTLAFVDGSLALDFQHPAIAAEQIAEAARARPFAAIVPTSDATSVIAALAAAALGLRHNPPDAAYAARNKLRMRQALAAAGVPSPAFASFPVESEASAVSCGFPCVVKPLLLSGSRGVMRADDPAGLARAAGRLRALLGTPEMRAAAVEDPAGGQILVEEFIPGEEVAVEAILRRGELTPLAIFDKPDPLDGPFFEETIYVTPSRRPAAEQAALVETTRRAARAMGLVEGPIHAELRVPPGGAPVVIEVAARPIGGLCSRTLRFSLGDGARTLEEVVVAAALGQGEGGAPLRLEGRGSSGVMMVPIPRGGVLQAVAGVEEARAVPHVVDVTITSRVGEKLVPLPEGSSYLGFLFARADTPAAVEEALREAHRRLRFDVAPLL